MGGSLIVGPYDLLDQSSPVILLGKAGTDMGAGVPDVQTVARILLDGDVVSGVRTGNRVLKLVVSVLTDSIGASAAVMAALGSAVDQAAWTISWTPDAGQPTVLFDCFRGSVSRNWDSYFKATTLTLTIPALPFTRDATITLLNPATPVGVIPLHTFDSTTGLVVAPGWVNVNNSWVVDSTIPPGGFGHATRHYDAGVGGDTPPSTYTLDTSSHVAGTGSVKVFTPSTFQQGFSSSANWEEQDERLTPLTMQGTIAATDLSAMQTVAFSAMSTIGSIVGGTHSQSGIDSSQADGSLPFGSGLLALTLIDSTGLRSTWTIDSTVGTAWARYYFNIQSPPAVLDAGFDITTVTGWRVRLYATAGLNTVTAASPELYPNLSGGTPYTHLVNCTLAGAIPVPSSAATMEWSWLATVPVTPGSAYSGNGTVVSTNTNPSRTTQIGIEWLKSDGTILSTTWGTAVASVNQPTLYYDGSPGFADVAAGVVAAATAPSLSAKARIRFRVLNPSYTGDPNTGERPTPQGPHIVAGSTAHRYPYGNVSGAYMWMDDLNALPAGAGAVLSGPYAQTIFTGVEGVARTPISLAVNATGTTPKRLLIARTPDPDPSFTPFLDTPTSVKASGGSAITPTTDATALTGHYYNLGLVPGQAGIATYTVPARAYGSTYAVMARIQRSTLVTVSPQMSANLSGDAVNVSSCGRTFVTTGVDATTLPAATWCLVPLGVLTLPPRAVSGSNTAQNLVITLTDPLGSASTLRLDMLVLVDLAGEMVFIDAPAGNAWYWLDSADASQFTGSMLAGSVADRSDALSVAPWQHGQAVLNFDPGANALTVLMDQATSGGTVAVSYYPRWSGERPN